jgi:multidrug resistance efflux pump
MLVNLPIHENGDTIVVEQKGSISNQSLRSDIVQEIISRKPGIMERWALLLFLVILIFIILGTWVLKYPDVIQASATLTADNSPKDIVIRQDGKLVKLFVSNDDSVYQGQMIGWIESTADHSELIDLSEKLNKGEELLLENRTENVSALFDTQYRKLGELQTYYQQFIVAWQQFNDYLVNGYYYRQKRILLDGYLFLQKMHKALEQQRFLAQKDVQLTEEAFEADDTLYKDKVISTQDLRDLKSKLIGKQLSIPQLESSLLTVEAQENDKQKEIEELEHNISQQKIIFEQALQTLKSTTDDWIKKYIIKAPVTGQVAFIVPLQENQFMQTGKTVGFINPLNSRFYAQVTLPQNNFGKIKKGQMVQLRFDAYPYQEFGIVEGNLSYISKIPTDSGFLANIELPKGLVTNYRNKIQYRSGLKSQALIITRNTRLLQRFYYSIVKTVNR